jgi:putative Holliday junction resolvase
MTRIIGLDVGDKTIGVAVSDELGLTAQGVTVQRRTSLAADLVFLRELIAHYQATALVVGLPKNMDGSIGSQAQKTLAFVERIRQNCSIPVVMWDERLTTRAAERVLLAANTSRQRRKAVRDRIAAQLILQSYLEWHTRHPEIAPSTDVQGVTPTQRTSTRRESC